MLAVEPELVPVDPLELPLPPLFELPPPFELPPLLEPPDPEPLEEPPEDDDLPPEDPPLDEVVPDEEPLLEPPPSLDSTPPCWEVPHAGPPRDASTTAHAQKGLVVMITPHDS